MRLPASRRRHADIGFLMFFAAAPAAADTGNLFDLSLEELGQLIVTGTRIRGSDVAVPTKVVTRGELENTAWQTVEELFEDLPQNFDEVTPDGRFANEGGSLLRGLNNSRVTAVDLRGLGAQSTLTLVNGRRRAGSIGGRAVDISGIPLSIVERVEVVTGGRSAIYGADAVAGVVNLVTRRDFEGAESQVSYGGSGDGGERLLFSQIVGIESDRGGFVGAYDYLREWPLDLADAGLLSQMPNPEIGLTQLSLNAQAENRRHTLYLYGDYALNPRLEIYGEALYTDKEFEDFALRRFAGAVEDSFTDTVNPSEHASLSAGIRASIAGDWALDVSGGWSAFENESRNSLFVDLGFTSFSSSFTTVEEVTLPSASAVFDGPLPAVFGVTARAAAGIEWRREEFDSAVNGAADADLGRHLRSVFAELSIPLLETARPGVGSLDVSLAGRYDDYSDVGGSFNPQVGIVWTPVTGLTLRGAFSSAFRAPALVELEGSTDAFLELVPDPAQGGDPVPVLFVQGEDPGLGPEEADTWSVGVDYEPEFAPWAGLSLSYYAVDYDGRIEQPTINADRDLVLLRESRFPGLVTRDPTGAEASALLDADADGLIPNDTGVPFVPGTQDVLEVFPDLVLFDNRTSNIAIERVRGLDLGFEADFETDSGTFDFGLNLAHILEHERSVTANSPPFGLLDDVGKPADTRVRVRAGWMSGVYGAFMYLNHVDGYDNSFSTPPSGMDSWTTLDVTLRFYGSRLDGGGSLAGIDATLGVANLLDEDPPVFPNSLLGVLYDSTNASPFGRFVSLRLTKHW